MNYYDRFFPNLSTVAFRTNNLLKKNQPCEWTKDGEEVYKRVKEQMYLAVVLAHRNSKLPLALVISPFIRFADGTETPPPPIRFTDIIMCSTTLQPNRS